MTGRSSRDDDGDDAPTVADPASLLDRDDVVVDDRSEVVTNQHHADLYDPIDGMAVVGVTDDDGRVLVLVHDDAPVVLLPHAPVGPDDDWVTSARRAVEDATGVSVAVDGVERVKRRRYAPDADGTQSSDADRVTAYQVFFAASPATEATTAVADADDWADWTARWVADLPVDPDGDHEETLDDVRRFLD